MDNSAQLIINRSYIYTLPMLTWATKETIVNSQLRGVFIGDVDRPELDQHIFLLYRFSGERWFTVFETFLQNNDLYVTAYDPDEKHVMFVYDVPDEYKYSYEKFRHSLYSQISEELKQQIISFHGETVTKKVASVMYKHESSFQEWEEKLNSGLPRQSHVKIPRELEAASILDMSVEMYDINNYKSNSTKNLFRKKDD